jgi:hypothetical protein
MKKPFATENTEITEKAAENYNSPGKSAKWGSSTNISVCSVFSVAKKSLRGFAK